MKKLTIIPAICAVLALSACAMTTAGVTKGDERNFARSVNDVSAGRAIKARLNRAYDFDLDKVDVEVAEGIVVLTGSAPSEKDRQEAERIAWSGPNIVQVGNEITLNSKTGVIRSSKDAFLSTAIKSRMIAEKNVKARNVNIETHNGVVYLMGVARDQAELERIAYIASTTDGTKEVVSYIKIADRPVTSSVASTLPETFGTPQYFGQPLETPPLGSTIPQLPTPNGLSAQTELPQLTAPQTVLPETEPYYRDPETGERIILPPGTKTIPYRPGNTSVQNGHKIGDAPFYINPSTGEKVQIVWTGN